MTWAEFRKWAETTYGYRFRNDPSRIDSAWRTIWGNALHGRAGTSPGHYAVYTVVQQRRFAFWYRATGLLGLLHIEAWLMMAERYDDGWLVNDGRGVRWVADPKSEAVELARRGFVAVKCGL